MAEGDAVGPTQFEFYEGIRILLPGAMAVGLAVAIGNTFSLRLPRVKDNPVGLAVLAVLVGLVFYFVDAPSKTAIFMKNLPSDTLRNLRAPARGFSAINLFFVMSDEVLPAGIRARGLYMGSMFRIGLEAIYLLVLCATGVLNLSLSYEAHKVTSIHRPTLPAAILPGIVIAFLVPVSIELERRRRQGGKFLPDEGGDSIPNQFGVVTPLAVLFLVVLPQAVFYIDGQRHVRLVEITNSAAIVFWAVRYFRGYRRTLRRRDDTNYQRMDPLNRVAATSIFTLMALPTALDLVFLRDKILIGRPEFTAWAGALVLGGILIVARGHEKRLGGAYATQNTWIKLHATELLASYLADPAISPSTFGDKSGPTPEKLGSKLWRYVQAIAKAL